MKKIFDKIFNFINRRKGICIVVLFVAIGAVYLLNSNIETPKQHDARIASENEDGDGVLISVVEDNTGDSSDNSSEETLQETTDGTSIKESSKSIASTEPSDEDAVPLTKSSTSTKPQIDTGASTNIASATGTPSQTKATSATGTPSQTKAASATGTPSQTKAASATGTPSQTKDESATGTSSQTKAPASKATKSATKSAATKSPSTKTPSVNTTDTDDDKNISVQFSINCKKILNNPDLDTTADIPEDGIFFSGSLVVKNNSSVYDVLKAVCNYAGISYVNSGTSDFVYISSIDNLAEKQCGRYSGWKYKVNGTVPNRACDKCTLSDGDIVEWYYVTDYNG